MGSKLVKRYKKKRARKSSGSSESRSSAKSNPPPATELAEWILPGFAGFGAARLATYIATSQIEQRKPTWGRWGGGAAAIGTFFAAWLLAHRVKFLEKYQTPIVVGTGIAAIQSLLQLFIPRIGWMVSDAQQYMTPGQTQTSSSTSQVASGTSGFAGLPPGLQPVDEDPADFVYDDRYDAGRMSQAQPRAAAPAQQAQAAADNLDLDDLEMDDLHQMGVQ